MKARMLFGDEMGFPNACLYTNPLGLRFAFRLGDKGIGVVISTWSPYMAVDVRQLAEEYGMSVYLYLKCVDCNKFTDVIGRNTSRPERWYLYTGSIEAVREIADFLVNHMGHHLTLVHEGIRYPEESPFRYQGRFDKLTKGQEMMFTKEYADKIDPNRAKDNPVEPVAPLPWDDDDIEGEQEERDAAGRERGKAGDRAGSGEAEGVEEGAVPADAEPAEAGGGGGGEGETAADQEQAA